jgi:glycosyltransferase involved in cell wall biosynthesis
MRWLFWISAGFLGYTLVGYPALLWIASRLWKRTHLRKCIWPTVSVVITAYNEGTRLKDKLLNTLALDYPREKLEIIVVSDGSEDDTDAAAESFSEFGIKLLKLAPRCGKNHAQMVARDASVGEILVFTDVSVHLEKRALQQIVSNFVDHSVGCVSSEDRVISDPQARAGEGAYVSFEMWLRRLESQLGSVVTASGSFFAVRRDLCKEWHPDQTSDFFVALHAIEQNRRVVVDPLSLGYYGLARQSGVEFQRKVRTIVNGLHVFFTHLRLLNPVRYPVVAWQLVSHKLCRWLSPFGILGILISSIFLYNDGWMYRACLVAQVAVYAAGLVTLLLRGLLRFPALKLASFFVLGNAATITAWFKFCKGERYIVWQPTRRG